MSGKSSYCWSCAASSDELSACRLNSDSGLRLGSSSLTSSFWFSTGSGKPSGLSTSSLSSSSWSDPGRLAEISSTGAGRRAGEGKMSGRRRRRGTCAGKGMSAMRCWRERRKEGRMLNSNSEPRRMELRKWRSGKEKSSFW
jgi:hypothetical protein